MTRFYGVAPPLRLRSDDRTMLNLPESATPVMRPRLAVAQSARRLLVAISLALMVALLLRSQWTSGLSPLLLRTVTLGLIAVQHRADAYEGLAWANELTHRGYVVMVHDAFAFGSRKVRLADVPLELRGSMKDDTDDSAGGVAAYNDFAADHEHIMAKSLFSAGTTR